MFSDENSGDPNRLWLSLNMAGPHQLNADAFAAATALRNSLADDLFQWQLMETRLRRASREVLQYCRSVFTRCDDILTWFYNFSTHELGQTQELQAFSAKFASLKRDMVGCSALLAMMSAEFDNAASAAQKALILSPHISTDPPLPPHPTHCDESYETKAQTGTSSQDLVAQQNQAPQPTAVSSVPLIWRIEP
jgi:hypothetical protein